MAYLEIILKSDLCAANGSSSGNAIDQDICMNDAGIPYIPARRLKGCLRESAVELLQYGYEGIDDSLIDSLFGNTYGETGKFVIEDAKIKGCDEITRWLHYVRADKTQPEDCRRMAHPANLVCAFSEVRGQTKMENGVIVDGTLRTKRVLNHYNPLENYEKETVLYAPIYLLTQEDKYVDFLKDCIRVTRHIGMNRNRGLGNVEMVFHDEEEKPISVDCKMPEEVGETIKISYMIELLSEITLPGCEEMMTMIPARSVIGAMSSVYLKEHEADDEFEDLFLNGKVRWSALTPVIQHRISTPVPNYVMKLKNAKGKIINTITEDGDDWKLLKPKTMEGYFMVTDENRGSYIAAPEVNTRYHNSKHGIGLYTQDSIMAGMIYGGTVEAPAKEKDTILELIKNCGFRFGRSKNVQYSSCRLYKNPVVETIKNEEIKTIPGEDVYLVLESDLALMPYGVSITDTDGVKSLLADMFSLEPVMDGSDNCSFHTIGGFQTMWQLQKPQINVIKAGSVYHFRATKDSIPSCLMAGEYNQEGFGKIRVVTKNGLEKEAKYEECTIDKRDITLDFASKEKMEVLLLTMAGRDAMKRYAREFKLDKDKRDIPEGRLRVMLAESKNLEDLKKRIDSIKTSDVSSENESGRKGASLALIQKFYGENGVDLERLLPSDDKKLCKEIQGNNEAKKILLSEWKVPLAQFLHAYHYGKQEVKR